MGSSSPTHVHNVSSDGSVISWTYDDGTSDSASTTELVFILEPLSNRNAGFIIALLRESTSQERPFILTTLVTSRIPAEAPSLEVHRISALPTYLIPTADRAVDVLVSTKSGTHLSLAFYQTVLHPLWELVAGDTLLPDVVITQDAHSVQAYARSLQSRSEATTAVLLSGDGAVVDVLNGGDVINGGDRLNRGVKRPSLVLLPLGTANALFHSLHRPLMSAKESALVVGLRTLFAGQEADLPVFRADFSPGAHAVASRTAVSRLYGAVVASYGFHASIVHESDSPEYRIHGAQRFEMVARELLATCHPYRADVRVAQPVGEDEQSIGEGVQTIGQGVQTMGDGVQSIGQGEQTIGDGIHTYVLVTPLSNLERGFTISPASTPLDGVLRMIRFGNVGAARTMDVMMAAYDGGRHVGMRWDDGHEVSYREVGEVTVTVADDDDRWRVVCVDGTIVQLPSGGRVSVTREETGFANVVVDRRVRNA